MNYNIKDPPLMTLKDAVFPFRLRLPRSTRALHPLTGQQVALGGRWATVTRPWREFAVVEVALRPRPYRTDDGYLQQDRARPCFTLVSLRAVGLEDEQSPQDDICEVWGQAGGGR